MIEDLSHEEGLRELGLLSLEERRLKEISSMYRNIRREGAKKTEPDFFSGAQ